MRAGKRWSFINSTVIIAVYLAAFIAAGIGYFSLEQARPLIFPLTTIALGGLGIDATKKLLTDKVKNGSGK